MARSPKPSRPSRAASRWPGPLTLFVLAALAAAAADLSTPLFVATPWIGGALLLLIVVLAVASLGSGAKGFEARIAALILPTALCGWAIFQLREKPPGAPASGVVAQMSPQAEALQAAALPVSAGTRAALHLEATIKSGADADRNASIAEIGREPSEALQKFLYQTAARFGDADQKQRVVIALLTRRAGRPLPVNLRSEDNLTMQSQYLDGATVRFEPIDIAVLAARARLSTNKEDLGLAGTLASSDLTVTGAASLAGKGVPLTMTARLTPDLNLSGVFHFGQGTEDTPFTIPLWETGPATPQSAEDTPSDQ